MSNICKVRVRIEFFKIPVPPFLVLTAIFHAIQFPPDT